MIFTLFSESKHYYHLIVSIDIFDLLNIIKHSLGVMPILILLRGNTMQNLVRVSKADNLPFKKQTFYKWFHLGKYPEIFVKFGGSLFVDVDRLSEAIDRSRPQRQAE